MKDLARNLRKAQTMAEDRLWFALRGRRFSGYKFRRQQLFSPYIVDFVCLKEKLIIEVDGSQHLSALEYDTKRTLFLNELGFRVLRFWNNQVMYEFKYVLDQIYNTLVLKSEI